MTRKDIKKEKKEMRSRVLAIRDGMPADERAAAGRSIADRLFDFAPFADAETVMLFVSFRSEVPTEAIIRRAIAEGKRVVVPVSILKDTSLLPTEIRDYDSELREGTFGIPEPVREFIRPVDPEEIDFVVVPGSVFDREGNRIGYGKGFYDRFRERLRPGVAYAALAFSYQVLDVVPFEDHDKKVDFIITETETIDCAGNR